MKRVIKSSVQSSLKRLYGRLYNMDPEAREAFIEGMLFAIDAPDLLQEEVNNIYEIYHTSEDPMAAIKQYLQER